MSKTNFPVSSGLLEKKHIKQIGSAIWLFLWLIDKTTKDYKGLGIVLGGKPIKISEISQSLGERQITVKRNIKKLQQGNYILTKRTQYGNIFLVKKSIKWLFRSIKNDTSEHPRSIKNDTAEVSKMILTYIDSTVDSTYIPNLPDGKNSILKGKNMRTYNENQFQTDGLPEIDAETNEPVQEPKKDNKNMRWVQFRAFWEVAVLKELGFKCETDKTDKIAFHRIEEKLTPPEVKRLVWFFLKSKKAKEHPNITACFSKDTINLWKQNER